MKQSRTHFNRSEWVTVFFGILMLAISLQQFAMTANYIYAVALFAGGIAALVVAIVRSRKNSDSRKK